MSHRIIKVEHWYNNHEGSQMYELTFQHGTESHRMLCGEADDGEVQVSHSEQLASTSNMDELVMERMARSLVRDAGHYFREDDAETDSPRVKIDILNEYYEGDTFHIIQHSGALEDLPDEILDTLTARHVTQLSDGDWITILDGEVISIGDFHPYHVRG